MFGVVWVALFGGLGLILDCVRLCLMLLVCWLLVVVCSGLLRVG